MTEKSVLIEKLDGTGEASVIESEFKKHYPDTKYRVLGPETPESFEVVGVPKPKTPRKRPAAKKTAPKPAPVAEPEAESV